MFGHVIATPIYPTHIIGAHMEPPSKLRIPAVPIQFYHEL